ncbi:MAG: hypothetical protein PWQ16_1539 [bacterium]|nr:hypothetical protein [bacterium]
MKLREIVNVLECEVLTGDLNMDEEILYGYTSDLLSEVIGKAKAGSIWITIQSHLNIIAVAVLVGIKAIVICEDKSVDSKIVEKAKEEGVALLRTKENAFRTSGFLFKAGLN